MCAKAKRACKNITFTVYDCYFILKLVDYICVCTLKQDYMVHAVYRQNNYQYFFDLILKNFYYSLKILRFSTTKINDEIDLEMRYLYAIKYRKSMEL